MCQTKGMPLSYIPVAIIAADMHEYQALSDVLASGQAGSLALAAKDETPLAVLVCPSGDAGQAGSLPCVVLGQRTGPVPESAAILPIPAALTDVFASLESLAQAAANMAAPREHAGWKLDPARLCAVTPAGKTVSLTDTEARLLACLFDAKGEEVERGDLLQRVWGYRPGLDTHTVETHIYRLRQKLEATPSTPALLVTTEDGYRFDPA